MDSSIPGVLWLCGQDLWPLDSTFWNPDPQKPSQEGKPMQEISWGVTFTQKSRCT